MVDREPDKKDYTLPDFWKREIRRKEHETGRTITRDGKFERCVLCANYDFTFPISIYACDRCRAKALGFKQEVRVLVAHTISLRPCFYCGRREGTMQKIHSRSCAKCIGVIARMTKKG